jgi:16S rRNA (guanine(966)-N(2))-methyltransferase RsmD
MRVIAGKYRSRPLQSLRGIDIRPTSDRLRETLFDILCAGDPHALASTVWLDLYAGTGAVGIEALSRGAAQVTFVEKSAAAAELIHRNLKALGVTSGAFVMRAGVGQAIAKVKNADYVFVDPPYRMEKEYASALRALAEGAVLNATSIVIVEHDRRFDPGEEHGDLRRYRQVKQGDAVLSFYRAK